MAGRFSDADRRLNLKNEIDCVLKPQLTILYQQLKQLNLLELQWMKYPRSRPAYYADVYNQSTQLLFQISTILLEIQLMESQIKYLTQKIKFSQQKRIRVSFTELLIFGYIRSVQHQIIPFSLFKLCYLFCRHRVFIFLFDNNNSRFYITNMHSLTTKFKSTRIGMHSNKIISQLIPHRKISKLSSSTWCYIPHISSYMNIKHDDIDMNSNKCYDGLIGTHMSKNQKIYPTILFFESKQINDIKIKFHSKTSTKYLNLYTFSESESGEFAEFDHEFIFCDRYGIVYENNYNLYQLDLNNVNMLYRDWYFVKINQNQKYINNSSFKYYLSMSYLKNNEKILAIYIKKPQCSCAMFDLSKNKWTEISSYSARRENLDGLHVGICKNYDIYDSNKIFTVNNYQQISKYDINQDKWIKIKSDKCCNDFPKFKCKPWVWIEDNPSILYTGYKKYFAYFDIRINNNNWREIMAPYINYDNLFI